MMVTRRPLVAGSGALTLLALGVAACAGCGDVHPPAGTTSAAGGAGAGTSTTASSSTTTTGGAVGGFGGDDGREWKNLEWEGLPCSLLVAGPTVHPTLTWKPCAAPNCSFIDPSAFIGDGIGRPVSGTVVRGNVVSALVYRGGGYDSVVWDATTGQERFAIRGHPDCMPKRFLPFVSDGEERGWFGVGTSGGGLADHAYYEVDLATVSASRLAVPEAMSSQRMAGDADHLALETSLGPTVGIWSRDGGTFTLLQQMSFRPRTGGGAVYFLGPDAGADLDVFWWQNGSTVAAVTASSGTFAVNPWVVGSDLVWTEAPAYDQPGVVKRAPLVPSAFPLSGDVVVSLAYAGDGHASERFYVSATKIDLTVYRLQVVNLQDSTVAIIDLPPEVKWPSTVDFVGKDSFGEKEVAWVQANDTVYRIEIE